MIDRSAFLADAQKLLAKLEKDLRARCDDMPDVGRAVETEYKRAKDAGRTGQTLEEWRADAITQQAVAWVLSCVFVRFLEDNRLVDPPNDGRQLYFPPVLPHRKMLPCGASNATAVDQRSSSDFRPSGGRIFRLGQRSGTPRQNRTYPLCFYLALFAPTASVTVGTPGETESGSAGEQPDEG